MTAPARISFEGAENNRLAGDLWDGGGRPVLLLHGGGQTRRAWDATARRLMKAGLCAITLDQRGHGESGWVESGDYRFAAFGRDVAAVARQIRERHGVPPMIVGASLGGLASLAAEQTEGPLVDALVLVDVVPEMDPGGVGRILGFMGERMDEGFATMDEAASAIARYLPNRKRAVSHDGLRKNLRLDADGRYRWHWDPAFMSSTNNILTGAAELLEQLTRNAGAMTVPLLVVRGVQSELVGIRQVQDFVARVPGASYVDVSGAGHMVAGDRNDAFTEAVLEFLTAREVA